MPVAFTPVISVAHLRGLEQALFTKGLPSLALMEAAGKGCAARIIELAKNQAAASEVLILCGPGNNGGDGLVVARYLAEQAWRVHVSFLDDTAPRGGDAAVMLQLLPAAVTRCAWQACGPRLEQVTFVVDALFGTGLTRPPTGMAASIIETVNAWREAMPSRCIVALDVPSGLDADHGRPLPMALGATTEARPPHGTTGPVVQADHTLTMGYPKLGLITAPGFMYAGQLHVVRLGLPFDELAAAPAAASDEPAGTLSSPQPSDAGEPRRSLDARCTLLPYESAWRMEPGLMAGLRRESPLAHKGTRGHVLVLAGSPGKTGAAVLAATAGLRAGAGLCTLASNSATQMAAHATPELMTLAWQLGLDPVTALEPLLRHVQATLIGPGMATDATARAGLADVLAQITGPLVLDADALNHLALTPEWACGLSPERVVLTPHPGEAGRLLRALPRPAEGLPSPVTQRVAAARVLALDYHAVVVLKGARTVVAHPDGRAAICPVGGPSLATAGTGDILAGMVAARLASGTAPFDAACQAVYWHGLTGDALMATHGQSAMASDVLEALPRVRLAHRIDNLPHDR